MTTTHPRIIIETAAATKDLATSVRLLNASVVGSIDKRGLESPVILAATELKRPSWSGDHVNFPRV